MTDSFTIARISKLLADWRQKHGRDINISELISAGFQEVTIDRLVRDGHLTKHQVTAQGGRRENRYRLSRDWRALN